MYLFSPVLRVGQLVHIGLAEVAKDLGIIIRILIGVLAAPAEALVPAHATAAQEGQDQRHQQGWEEQADAQPHGPPAGQEDVHTDADWGGETKMKNNKMITEWKSRWVALPSDLSVWGPGYGGLTHS